MDHLVEIAADQIGDVAEHGTRGRVRLANSKVGVDQIDAERGLGEQRLELCRAQPERLLGGSAHVPELEQRTDAGEQLSRRKRLDDIVVGTRVESLDPCFLAGARGQQQHGHAAQSFVGANRGQQPEAVQTRHHDVAENEIGRATTRGRERLLAVGHGLDHVVGSQQIAYVAAHVGVVVGEHDPRAERRGEAPIASEERIVGLRIRAGGQVVAWILQPAQRLLDEGLGPRSPWTRARAAPARDRPADARYRTGSVPGTRSPVRPRS